MSHLISPDRRKTPCSSSTDTMPRLGGCVGQYSSASAHVPLLRNVTRYKNYVTGSTAYVSPYTLANQSSAPDCSPYFNGGYVCGDYGVTNCNLPCYPGPVDLQPACGGGTSSFSLGISTNCYAVTTESVPYSPCQNVIGFKNVYASKYWNGKPPYNGGKLGLPDSFDWCCSCYYHGPDTGSPNTTKYLAMSSDYTQTITNNTYTCTSTTGADLCCPDPEGGPDICSPDHCYDCSTLFSSLVQTSTATNVVHIDIYGNSYVDSCSSGSTGYPAGTEEPPATAALLALGEANADTDVLYAAYCEDITAFNSSYGAPYVITNTGPNVKHIEWAVTQSCYDHCSNLISETIQTKVALDIDIPAGTLRVRMYGPTPKKAACVSDDITCIPCDSSGGTCEGDWGVLSDENWLYNGTVFSHTLDAMRFDSISVDTHTVSVNEATLSTPYLVTTAEQTAQTLLAQFPMSDDYYPWRIDDKVTIGPYVHYDEGAAQPAVGSCTGSAPYSGVIIGQPGPKGIDRIWDKDHANYCVCSDDGGVTFSFFIKDYGAWSTDIGVPRATSWLDARDGGNIPQGAFNLMNQSWTTPPVGDAIRIYDDKVWVGKWAEVIIPKPSYAWDRPCGPDRFQISQSTERCISDATTNVLQIEASGPAFANIPSPGLVYVCGTSTWDGVWSASIAGHAATLTEPRIISASQMANSPVTSCGSGLIMGLRWNIGAVQPAICGRIPIVSANNNHPITCSFDFDADLINGDGLVIAGAVGNVINGTWPADVIDTRTVALRGSNGISQSVYTGSGYASSFNASDYKWNDTSRKNEYTVRTWSYDFRTIDEYYRLAAQTASLLGTNNCNVTASFCSVPAGAMISKPRPFSSQCGMDEAVSANTCSTHCLPLQSCSPSVAYFSPTSESLGSSARNHGFQTMTHDSQYGSMWIGIPVQSMDDPLKDYPPCPCAFDDVLSKYDCPYVMKQDDGTCHDDVEPDPDVNPIGTKYFKLPDQYEARCTVPVGAPALPPNVYIGCLNVSEFTNPCPGGNICNAPFFDANAVFDDGPRCPAYSIIAYDLPWLVYLNRKACVCSDGHFAVEYWENGVSCGQHVPI